MSYLKIIKENILLAPLTTFKIGGAARFFVEAKSEDEIISAFKFAEENELPLFVLGGGSNVLISDEGFDGLVLQVSLKGIEIKKNIVTAKAGEDWDEFVKFCVDSKLAGIECLSGIPGFVGGTPVQNVGAYGQEVSETIETVRAFDRKTKEILELTNADCKFAYRTGIFNTTEKNRFIILAVSFKLIPDGEPKIVYKDLHERYGHRKPTLSAVRKAVLKIRRSKSMVIDEKDPNSQSAGSFFKNPIVSNEEYQLISQNAETNDTEDVPKFRVDENKVKIPAAWLIEKSGFQKGFQFGNVGLSTNHALAIINFGGATAREVLALKNEIQKSVKEKFGIDLQPEPIFVGFGKENL